MAGKLAGEKFGELTLFECLAKKVGWISRSTKMLLIVSINLDGFSLANHRRFTKFAELSPRQTFPLYSRCSLTDVKPLDSYCTCTKHGTVVKSIISWPVLEAHFYLITH